MEAGGGVDDVDDGIGGKLVSEGSGESIPMSRGMQAASCTVTGLECTIP